MVDKQFDTLDDWLKWIEGLHPVKWDLGLQRVSRVAEQMSLLEPSGKLFLVAGTNGKGTTIAMMDQILRTAGFTTGVSTSPHLIRFNERICLNGMPVSDTAICAAFERINLARKDISLTYFEFATLAALDIFRRADPDVIILEIGLGGRLDAMNITDPDVSIITTIQLDHQSWLGSDLESIGREKAGIMRRGKPAITGPDMPESITEKAAETGARIVAMAKDFQAVKKPNSWEFHGHTDDGKHVSFSDLPYNHLPFDNCVIAVQALVSSGLSLSQENIKKGLSQVKIAGRYQTLPGPVPVILDVAHNPHAAERLAMKLKSDMVPGKTHAVVAMYADKDCESVLRHLDPVVDLWYFADMDDDRAESAVKLVARLSTQQRSDTLTCDRVSSAFHMARKNAVPGDRIVVFGSFPAVAEVMSEVGTEIGSM
ncbi:MAG: bifunctional tetrahydrofolate synthase/dihydrofolate synthase [Gammaproteobacteria bacterium]|nr:bifunctional tetrahydrofolate synthase/dihydrofolate synthase [Gammaproteobacteria bacterium]